LVRQEEELSFTITPADLFSFWVLQQDWRNISVVISSVDVLLSHWSSGPQSRQTASATALISCLLYFIYTHHDPRRKLFSTCTYKVQSKMYIMETTKVSSTRLSKMTKPAVSIQILLLSSYTFLGAHFQQWLVTNRCWMVPFSFGLCNLEGSIGDMRRS